MYHYKESLISLLNLDKNTKYHITYISSLLREKKITNNIIKNLYPDFKSCNCKGKTCMINYDDFIKYIKLNLLIDDGTPECSYYFAPNIQPVNIDMKDFI
jgi:hypothetical protein